MASLASDDAAYITGQTIRVNGGMSMGGERTHESWPPLPKGACTLDSYRGHVGSTFSAIG